MITMLAHANYDRQAIKAALAPVLATAAPLARPARGEPARFLLKPNFVAPANDASVTHPAFYMAVAEWLLEQGHSVGIGESPAFGRCQDALQTHGVYEECLARGISIVNFKDHTRIAGVPEDKHYRSLTIARELREWDAVINLPKLKTHQQFTFTGATKNLYGCVAGKRKFYRHNLCANDPVRFARMILRNAEQAACVLHIGDGISAMHVKGPRGGRPYPLNKIIVSDDYLALDWLFCRLVNLDPKLTPLFKALDPGHADATARACAQVLASPAFQPVTDFVHAPLIHISFTPWHMARSLWRLVNLRLVQS